MYVYCTSSESRCWERDRAWKVNGKCFYSTELLQQVFKNLASVAIVDIGIWNLYLYTWVDIVICIILYMSLDACCSSRICCLAQECGNFMAVGIKLATVLFCIFHSISKHDCQNLCLVSRYSLTFILMNLSHISL